jgi:hypothetical protein
MFEIETWTYSIDHEMILDLMILDYLDYFSKLILIFRIHHD